MTTFKVKGGFKLKGDIHPQGAKNEALQVLCAVLLTSEEVVMENVPDIRDVNILINLLKDLNPLPNTLLNFHVSIAVKNNLLWALSNAGTSAPNLILLIFLVLKISELLLNGEISKLLIFIIFP